MIISASRRTDIPAFYAEWFMRRIREGYCLVTNPMYTDQVSRVSLSPEDVDVIVFWSKNPAALLPHLGQLDAAGFRYYFQFTLNDYPRSLEPGVEPISNRLRTFQRLSDLIGPPRVIWRYDPIIVSSLTDYDYHRAVFERLAKELAPFTRRVVISIVDYYSKTKRNLKRIEDQGFRFVLDPEQRPETDALLAEIAGIAAAHGLDIRACAEKKNYQGLGISPGSCVDGELIQRLFGIERLWKKDNSQRELCGCVKSKDIGANETCAAGCLYCYATKNAELAFQKYKVHDPNATAL